MFKIHCVMTFKSGNKRSWGDFFYPRFFFTSSQYRNYTSLFFSLAVLALFSHISFFSVVVQRFVIDGFAFLRLHPKSFFGIWWRKVQRRLFSTRVIRSTRMWFDFMFSSLHFISSLLVNLNKIWDKLASTEEIISKHRKENLEKLILLFFTHIRHLFTHLFPFFIVIVVLNMLNVELRYVSYYKP